MYCKFLGGRNHSMKTTNEKWAESCVACVSCLQQAVQLQFLCLQELLLSQTQNKLEYQVNRHIYRLG